MPLAVASQVAGRRATHVGCPTTTESHVQAMRPGATLRGHLTFHLKHETPLLELLSRVFAHCDAGEISAWVADEPTGQCARRAAFLCGFSLESSCPSQQTSKVLVTTRSVPTSWWQPQVENTDRFHRFADVLACRTGQGDRPPLDEAALADLHREIMGLRTSVQRFGLRQSPVFFGEAVRYRDIVHCIAPPPPKTWRPCSRACRPSSAARKDSRR